MKLKFALPYLLLFPGALALQAQPKTGAPSQSAQANALDSMQKSLELQQISVQQQVPQEHVGDGFFQLSRPATLGATAAAPAPMIAPLGPIPVMFPMSTIAFANCDALPDEQVTALIDNAADHESLDRNLLRGIIRQESAFKPCAVSPKGAQGLMQLMPATAQQFGVVNPFDPQQNVEGGAKLLKQLLEHYNGDLGKALGAYNAGVARVDAANGIPQIPETQNYVKQILSFMPVIN